MRPLALVLALAICGVASHAAAFSDYELFAADPLLGGGGGRFFTGSPVDGFGCSVCHRGGLEPQVAFRGLPAGEYVPGATYDVEVWWSEPQVPHAMALEFINALGQAAGQLTPLEPLDAAGRCTGEAAGQPPVYMAAAGGRSVLMLDDCGAAVLRFRFVAPADPRVVFAASVVRSDGSETPDGDGVLEVRQVLMRQGTTAPPSTSTCSASTARPTRAGTMLVLGCTLALLARRRAARRRLSGSSS